MLACVLSEDEVKELTTSVIENFLSSWYKASRTSKAGATIVYLNDLEKSFLTKWFTELHMKIQKPSALLQDGGLGAWSQVRINTMFTIPYADLKGTHEFLMPIAEIAYVEGDFQRATENLSDLVKQSKNGGISLLIADAPYGATDEKWDAVAWGIDQFRGTLATVEYCNKFSNPSNPWEGVTVVWFISDAQWGVVAPLVDEYGLSFRQKVWVKPSSVHSQGPRLRQDHENMIIIWKGGEDQLCKFFDKNDSYR